MNLEQEFEFKKRWNGDLMRRLHPHNENHERLQAKLKALREDESAELVQFDRVKAEIRQGETARDECLSEWYFEFQKALESMGGHKAERGF